VVDPSDNAQALVGGDEIVRQRVDVGVPCNLAGGDAPLEPLAKRGVEEPVVRRDDLKGGFKQLYESPTPPRPGDVVAAMVRLVEQEDRRPFRTVVMPQGMDFGLDEINTVSTKTQEKLLCSMQLDKFL